MPILPHIPFMADSAKAAPLMRSVKAVAQKNGMSEFLVAKIMSEFLEEVAREVATGHPVRIPGFGIFAPKMVGRKLRRPAPCFVAYRPFNQEVFALCSEAKAKKGGQALKSSYTSHHPSSLRKDRSRRQRVFTAMEAFRQNLVAEQRKMGLV
jgi:hypothetical protein